MKTTTCYEFYILTAVIEGVEITYSFTSESLREKYIKDFILPSQDRGMSITYSTQNIPTHQKALLR